LTERRETITSETNHFGRRTFHTCGFTIADPDDRGMLDVVGFDITVPAVISDFVRE
jgi:hypothetical protein